MPVESTVGDQKSPSSEQSSDSAAAGDDADSSSLNKSLNPGSSDSGATVKQAKIS